MHEALGMKLLGRQGVRTCVWARVCEALGMELEQAGCLDMCMGMHA